MEIKKDRNRRGEWPNTPKKKKKKKKLHPTTRMKNGLKSEFKKHAILTSKKKKREFYKKRHANISFVFQEIVSE